MKPMVTQPWSMQRVTAVHGAGPDPGVRMKEAAPWDATALTQTLEAEAVSAAVVLKAVSAGAVWVVVATVVLAGSEEGDQG